jgi:peptidoglycan/xylan/chitin deacetylase (PgdA/CDA1 family)
MKIRNKLFKKRIICIHSIDDKTLTPQCFIQYVKAMRFMGYKFVSIENIMSKENSGKLLALTIDDGYKNNVTNLLPLLKKLKIPALLFVPTGLLGLKANDEELLNHNCYKNQETMTINDLLYWINEGFDVGFHTYKHINLSKVDSQHAELDFIQGMKFFEQIDYTPTCFAYPMGLLPIDKKRYEELLTRYGFKYAFTFNWGNVEDGSWYYTPRFSLGNNQSLWWSALKTIGVLDWYNHRKRKKYEKE